MIGILLWHGRRRHAVLALLIYAKYALLEMLSYGAATTISAAN